MNPNEETIARLNEAAKRWPNEPLCVVHDNYTVSTYRFENGAWVCESENVQQAQRELRKR